MQISDQPVINTYAVGLPEDAPTEQHELYYPTSPKLAVLITEKQELKTVDSIMLSEADVGKYNKTIIDQMHSQLYGASEEVLRRYMGRWFHRFQFPPTSVYNQHVHSVAPEDGA